MLEHYTTAIVLEVKPRGEIDAAVTIYSKDFGRLTAKAKSLRKITSKLAGHLLPGNLIKVRLIEHGDGNGFQILDALSQKPAGALGNLLKFMEFMNKMTPLALPDLGLWYEAEHMLESGDFSPQRYRRVLSELGFGPDGSKCGDCGAGTVAYFLPGELVFLCAESLKRLKVPGENAVRI